MKIDEVSSAFNIGRRGEKGLQTIELDVSDWLSQFPTGIFIVDFKPDELSVPFSLPLTQYRVVNDILIIDVEKNMTAKQGKTVMGVRLLVGDSIEKRTPSIPIEVEESLPSATGRRPDRLQEWIDDAVIIFNKTVAVTFEAEEAADLANEKAGLADTAALNANTKAGLANTAATNANTKAGLADTAAASVNTAITNAGTAATNANTKAGLADTAATNANTKAGLANTAALNADTKAALAVTATTNANTATTSANDSALNANAKAGLANTAALNADAKAALAVTATTNANTARDNANTATTNANTKAGLADTAATNANAKAGLANDAAILANSKAELADTAATNANTKAGLANTAASNADGNVIKSVSFGDTDIIFKKENESTISLANAREILKGDPSVYVGDTEPTDPAMKIWIDEDAQQEYSTTYEQAVDNGYTKSKEQFFADLEGLEGAIDGVNNAANLVDSKLEDIGTAISNTNASALAAQNNLLWRRLTTNPASFYPVPQSPLYVRASGEPIQEGTGDPSPENIRPITPWLASGGAVNIVQTDGVTITLTAPQDIYGGWMDNEERGERTWGVYVCDGNTPFTKSGADTYHTLTLPNWIASSVLCNVLKKGGPVDYEYIPVDGFSYFNGNNIVVNQPDYPLVADWKIHLQELYDAGTPIIFVYQLATPEPITLTPAPLLALPQADRITPRLNVVATDAPTLQTYYAKSPIQESNEQNAAIVATGV